MNELVNEQVSEYEHGKALPDSLFVSGLGYYVDCAQMNQIYGPKPILIHTRQGVQSVAVNGGTSPCDCGGLAASGGDPDSILLVILTPQCLAQSKGSCQLLGKTIRSSFCKLLLRYNLGSL